MVMVGGVSVPCPRTYAYYHEKCNFARLTFENRENCHASPSPIFFVFEGRGGVGSGMGED